MSFRAEASVELFRVYLEGDFEGVERNRVNETSRGEIEMLVVEGAGASYPDG